MGKNKSRRIHLRPEIFIMIVVIILLSIIVRYHDSHNDSLIGINESGEILLIHDKQDIEYAKSKGYPTFEYACHTGQSIEVTCNGITTDRILFESSLNHHITLISHPSVISAINNETQGVVDIVMSGVQYTINFAWVEYNDHKYLVQYIINQNKVFDMIQFTIFGHLSIILCYTVLLFMIYFQTRGVSNQYEKSFRDLYKDD